jgi:hypothetical protein
MITVSKVDSAQSVEIVAVGPGPTNRLFVFTGIAEINFAAGDNDDLHTDHAFLDVSSFHGDKLFDPDSAATKLAKPTSGVSAQVTPKTVSHRQEDQARDRAGQIQVMARTVRLAPPHPRDDT